MSETESPSPSKSLIQVASAELNNFLRQRRGQATVAGTKIRDLMIMVRHSKSPTAPNEPSCAEEAQVTVAQPETPITIPVVDAQENKTFTQIMEEKPETKEHLRTYYGHLNDLAIKCCGILNANTILHKIKLAYPPLPKAENYATETYSLLLGNNGLIAQIHSEFESLVAWLQKSQGDDPDLVRASNMWMATLRDQGRENLIKLARENDNDLPGVTIVGNTATVDIGILDPLRIARILYLRSKGNCNSVEQGLTTIFCFLQGSQDGVQKMIDVTNNVSSLENHF